MKDGSNDEDTEGVHGDSLSPFHDSDTKEYSVTIKYKKRSDKADYGPVDKRGLDYEIFRPASHVDILRREVHFEAQFHEANKDQWKEKTELPNNGGLLYSLAILDVAELVFEQEHIDPDAIGTDLYLVKHLLLKEARRIDSPDDYLNYLDEIDRPAKFPLMPPPPHKIPGVLSSAQDEIESAGLDDNLSRATQRAVFAAFRNGIVVPSDVSAFYGFDEVEPPFDETVVDDEEKWAELLSWMQELVDETTGPLSFGRTRPTYGILQLLGVLATSALTGAGVRPSADMARWDYGGDLVPYGGLINEYINEKLRRSADEIHDTENSERLPSINEQFDAVHRNTLTYADGLYFFRKSQRLAEDMTHIDTEKKTEFTIPGYTSDDNDATESWTFSVLSIIDNASRFTIGIRLLPDKSKYPIAVNTLLSNASEHFDVQGIFTDKEMISGDLINNFRSWVGSNWIASAPERDYVKRFISITPSNCIGYVESLSWNASIQPNAVAYPHKRYLKKNTKDEEDEDDDENIEDSIKATIDVPESLLKRDELDIEEIGQKTLSGYSASSNESALSDEAQEWFAKVKYDLGETPNVGNESSHAVYLTDRTLPERSAGGIRFGYVNRWGIEETIRQLKNDCLPYTDSSSPKIREYYMNIAVLFQNWHTLINRTPSPNLGYRLNVTSQEMLKALQHIAFKHEEDLPTGVTKPQQ